MESERLILRQWQDSDLKPFADLNADPEVMRYFPNCLSRVESDALAKYLQQMITERGWGFWAVELKTTHQFIGFVGLNSQDAQSGIPHVPLVEIGWRLAHSYWGQGYATEAAKLVLNYAFNTLKLTEVYAFTALINQASQRVMQRLGMSNMHADFNHPKVEKGHVLERHCLYKISKLKALFY